MATKTETTEAPAPKATKKENFNTGIRSREEGTTSIKNLWKKADKLEDPGFDANGNRVEWWPIEVIAADVKFSPRQHGRTNQARVERYSEIVDDLPPIVVNGSDGRLIDGKHRIEANQLASRNFIRVVVHEISEDDLFEAAFLANNEHGEGYTDRERAAGARRIWDALVIANEGKKPNQSEFARKYGITRQTIHRWIQEEAEAAALNAEELKAKKQAEKEEAKRKKEEAAAAKAAKAEAAARADGFHDVDEEVNTDWDEEEDDDDGPSVISGTTAPAWEEDDEDDEDGMEVFRRVATGIEAACELDEFADEESWDYHLQLLDVGGMNPTKVIKGISYLAKLMAVIQTGLQGQAEIAEEEGGDD